MSQQTISEVEQLIKTKPVFVASKTYCPYCSATKKLINEIYPEAYILELDTIEDGSEIQDALAKITGQRTVPNVFIKGKHIGGNSDLQALGKDKIKSLIG
ncbi:glutaredoxin [Pichia californica]|uniref:Glutaredoxin n=1 Tax=Pichia californica TaxID=460514 RepID=A0A9P6WIS2_9ASCO|nr:glutaredoxin [[Candida] californica]KAG0687915.1 glutaredoxin [[Candida] californica]